MISFAPAGLVLLYAVYPRLAAWTVFFRRFAAWSAGYLPVFLTRSGYGAAILGMGFAGSRQLWCELLSTPLVVHACAGFFASPRMTD